MIKFKVDDKVRVTELDGLDRDFCPNLKVGDTGIVLNESCAPFIRLDKPNGSITCSGLCEVEHGACFHQDRLELIETKTIIRHIGHDGKRVGAIRIILNAEGSEILSVEKV